MHNIPSIYGVNIRRHVQEAGVLYSVTISNDGFRFSNLSVDGGDS